MNSFNQLDRKKYQLSYLIFTLNVGLHCIFYGFKYPLLNFNLIMHDLTQFHEFQLISYGPMPMSVL